MGSSALRPEDRACVPTELVARLEAASVGLRNLADRAEIVHSYGGYGEARIVQRNHLADAVADFAEAVTAVLKATAAHETGAGTE